MVFALNEKQATHATVLTTIWNVEIIKENNMAKDTNMGTLDRSTGYLVKSIGGKKVAVHRLVAGARPGDIVDHINGDKLDNRVENLRIVSKSQNNRNRKDIKGYTMTPTGKFQVTISYQDRTYYLGRYETKEEALMVRKAVTKFAFEITGIDVQVESKPETIEIGGVKYEVSDDLKDALKKLKKV